MKLNEKIISHIKEYLETYYQNYEAFAYDFLCYLLDYFKEPKVFATQTDSVIFYNKLVDSMLLKLETHHLKPSIEFYNKQKRDFSDHRKNAVDQCLSDCLICTELTKQKSLINKTLIKIPVIQINMRLPALKDYQVGTRYNKKFKLHLFDTDKNVSENEM